VDYTSLVAAVGCRDRKSKCRKRGGTEHKQRTFSSADPERCYKPATALYVFSTTLKNNTTRLKIKQCVNKEVKVLVDTGSDVNTIKLSELQKDVRVNESTVYELTGIN